MIKKNKKEVCDNHSKLTFDKVDKIMTFENRHSFEKLSQSFKTRSCNDLVITHNTQKKKKELIIKFEGLNIIKEKKDTGKCERAKEEKRFFMKKKMMHRQRQLNDRCYVKTRLHTAVVSNKCAI